MLNTLDQIKDASLHILSPQEQLEEFQKYLKVYPTAVFWMEFLQICDILHRFNCYERKGNSFGHLSESGKMLPYLTAAGH